MENHEKWMELCALAAKEQDPAKLLALTKEINRLLSKKEQRIKGNISPTTSDPSLPPLGFSQRHASFVQRNRLALLRVGLRGGGTMNCQIEFANDDVGMPCGKTAVAKCSDCGFGRNMIAEA